jgi:hypothetical protein
MPVPVNDYIIFIHGVATRDGGLPSTYSDYLFGLIKTKCNQLGLSSNLIQVPLYWGDVSLADEADVLKLEQDSSIYAHYDAKDLRENFLLPFVGDAVAYISRFLGGRVVETLKAQAQTYLSGMKANEENRFHLVSHSWGTVILFDVLFASRWDDPAVFGAASAMEMRDVVFGLEPSPYTGVVMRSIHTMGSPLDIFSLMEVTSQPFVRTPGPVIPAAALQEISTNVLAKPTVTAAATDGARAQQAAVGPGKVADFVNAARTAVVVPQTHAVTPALSKLLTTLYSVLGKPLNWYNFAHPGDFVAYPLEKLMPSMLAVPAGYLNVQDFLVTDAGPQWFENMEPVTVLSAAGAHQSYWKSNLVAEHITQAIKMS